MTSAQTTPRHGAIKEGRCERWIGSALEYYDFFIYATAASLVFPQIFFPSENPTVAIVASLATTVLAMLPGRSAPSFSGIGATPMAGKQFCSSACS
jgi:hypothetical protein